MERETFFLQLTRSKVMALTKEQEISTDNDI